MLKSNVKLGSVFGIKIGIHYSWFLIALLIVFSFSANFRTGFPGMGGPQITLLAIGTAVLFFVSLLLHELSHSVVARSRGVPVREITLFALGGVSQLEGETVSYPLDGGRILRAALSWKWGDLERTTRAAAQLGQAVGFGFVANALKILGHENINQLQVMKDGTLEEVLSLADIVNYLQTVSEFAAPAMRR